jgi:hypothetical protein
MTELSLPTIGMGDWGDDLNAWLTASGAGVFNVLHYGAVGDGVTDDTVAIQAALNSCEAAGGGHVYVPSGVYLISAELTYDTTDGPLLFTGNGSSTILEAVGATNKVLAISGTPGATISRVVLQNFQVRSATSGTSAAGIHLSGCAVVSIHNVSIYGQGKMTNGIQLTGTQQGEISGGYIVATTTGILLENAGDVHSNGMDIHGVSMMCSGTNIVLDECDTVFIRSNHMTSAAIDIDIIAGGYGLTTISGNHFEEHTTAGVRSVSPVEVSCNSFFTTGGTDVKMLSGVSHALIYGNLLSGSVTFDSGSSGIRFFNNLLAGGTYTDNSTGIVKFGNSNTGGGPSNYVGGTLLDDLTLTSRSASSGDILKLNPNGSVGGAWGMTIYGAGVDQDIYVKLHDVVLAGLTTGGSLRIMASVGGTLWATFNGTGLALLGAIEIDGALNHDGSTVGFYGTSPIAKQTGVAVDATSIHAALVNLGLISA